MILSQRVCIENTFNRPKHVIPYKKVSNNDKKMNVLDIKGHKKKR